MDVAFSGDTWLWEGHPPWYSGTVPDDEFGELEAASRVVSYDWGMIPRDGEADRRALNDARDQRSNPRPRW